MIKSSKLHGLALSLITTALLSACGGSSDEKEANNSVAVNVAPTVNVAENFSADELTEVILEGSANDENNNISTYSWKQTSGPSVTITNSDTSTAKFTAPEIDKDQTATFELTVKDSDGLEATASVSVELKNVLVAPTLSFSKDLNFEEQTEITITPIAKDPNGEIVSYTWEQVTGKDLALTSLDGNQLVFVGPDILFEEKYSFKLTITDNDGQTAEAPFTITLNPVVSDQLAAPTGVEEVVIDGQTKEVATNEFLIHLNDDSTAAEQAAIIAKLETLGAAVVSHDDDVKLFQVRVTPDIDEAEVINQVAKLDGVRHSGYNLSMIPDALAYYENSKPLNRIKHRVSAESTEEPADTGFTGDYWINTIGADKAWAHLEGRTLKEVTIGIVDTGIPASQKTIDETRLTRLKVSATGKVTTAADDDTESTHGYWVTSFAAGHKADAENTVKGVNHHTQIIHSDVFFDRCEGTPEGEECKFTGDDKTFVTDLIAGAKGAIDLGASVVNLSWGDGSECSDTSEARLKSRREFRLNQTNLVEYAKAKDALLVYSAGNNCEKDDDQLLVEADDIAQDAWETNALIVAATDENNIDADFSRMGEVVNIAAPGHSISWGVDETVNGTSYAAPMVTGSAGLIKGVNSNLKAAEVRDILLATASNSVILSEQAREVGTTTPTKLLNVFSALQTADLTVGSEFESAPSVSLSEGKTFKQEVKYTLPEATVNAIDVMFLIDVSGSYSDDISNLKAQADTILANLTDRGLDVAFGVSAYSDFPIDPFGSEESGDEAFYLLQSVTKDTDAVKEGVNALETYFGGDSPESQLEALHQVITGNGRDINDNGDYNDTGDINPNSIGWREGALKVVLLATDASFHNSDENPDYPGAGKLQVINELKEAGITVFGLQSGWRTDTTADLESITSETNGQVFELSSDSSEIANAISEALDDALKEIDVSIEVISGGEWINSITPSVIEAAKPGQEIQFDVNLTGIKKTPTKELTYEIILWVRGDGSAVLKRVVIPITVPIASE